MTERAMKLVRLRDDMYATGKKRTRPRLRQHVVLHLVPIDADLDSSDGVRACCGVEFAAGTLVEVPWDEQLPHGSCLRRSPQPRPAIEGGFPLATSSKQALASHENNRLTDDGHGAPVFVESSIGITLTAQYAVNSPTVYIEHSTGSAHVDFAVSGPFSDDILANLKFTSPLEVITAGRNLINAGLSLAKTLGVDIDTLKAATDERHGRDGVTDAG